MSHWAQVDENNTVIRVTVGNNDDLDEGYKWLIDNLGGIWIKTSYNAINGKRRNPETGEITDEPAFRGNFAGTGYTYNEELDVFIPPKPFNSWILNEETYQWSSPIPYPDDDYSYDWDEETESWIKIDETNPRTAIIGE